MKISLIVGLGNPGVQYADTRHNVGWWWLDAFCEKFDVSLKEDRKLFACHGKKTIRHHTLHLIKPLTFMNLSGKAFLATQNFYKIPEEEILIVYDEIDLPVGTIRLKKGGGHGGHNGLRDILKNSPYKDFYRLRIGVGHPGDKHQVANYVLSKAKSDEIDTTQREIDRSIALVDCLLQGDAQKYMQALHTVET